MRRRLARSRERGLRTGRRHPAPARRHRPDGQEQEPAGDLRICRSRRLLPRGRGPGARRRHPARTQFRRGLARRGRHAAVPHRPGDLRGAGGAGQGAGAPGAGPARPGQADRGPRPAAGPERRVEPGDARRLRLLARTRRSPGRSRRGAVADRHPLPRLRHRRGAGRGRHQPGTGARGQPSEHRRPADPHQPPRSGLCELLGCRQGSRLHPRAGRERPVAGRLLAVRPHRHADVRQWRDLRRNRHHRLHLDHDRFADRHDPVARRPAQSRKPPAAGPVRAPAARGSVHRGRHRTADRGADAGPAGHLRLHAERREPGRGQPGRRRPGARRLHRHFRGPRRWRQGRRQGRRQGSPRRPGQSAAGSRERRCRRQQARCAGTGRSRRRGSP